MVDITRVQAFKDNYIWLLQKGRHVAAVDPGDAQPVIDFLAANTLQLVAILVTHHHADHQGGIPDLVARFGGANLPIFGPATESITGINHPLVGGERITLPELDALFDVMHVPGHTRGHLAFVAPGVVFCGDTLFGGGCGRLFEGSPAQLLNSLEKIASLPCDTRVYCAHEYTEANLRFALAVEPGNSELHRRYSTVMAQRQNGNATIPSSIAVEIATNPFLRCRVPEVIATAIAHGADGSHPTEVFRVLREWKNRF